MCAAPAERNPADGRAAVEARFSGAVVDAKVVLMFAAAIYPINAGAVVFDGRIQGLADASPQGAGFGLGECIAAPLRMQAGAVQRFVGVNVADPGDDGLIEQECFERAAARSEERPQCLRGETARQRFGAQPAGYFIRIVNQVEAAKFSAVAEPQVFAVVKMQNGVLVFG